MFDTYIYGIYIYTKSLAIVFRDVLKTLYIYTYIYFAYTYIFWKEAFWTYAPAPTYFWSFNVSKKSHPGCECFFIRPPHWEKAWRRNPCLGRWDANKKNDMFSWQLLYLKLWLETIDFLRKGLIFGLMMLSLSFWKSQWSIQMDRQHLANQLVWFIQRCLIVIHRRSKKSRYATTWFHQTIWGGSTVVSMLKVGQGLQFKS